MKRENLPFALLGMLVATQKTLDDQAALGRPVSLSDDVLIGGDASGGKRQCRKALQLVIAQRANAAQLTKENVMFVMKFGWFGHASPHQFEAGALSSLSHQRLRSDASDHPTLCGLAPSVITYVN